MRDLVLGRRWTPGLDLCLAATTLFLWFLLDGFQVQIACSRQVLLLAVDQPRWQPHWQVAPWLFVAVGLVAAWARLSHPNRSALLCQRLPHLTCLTLGLLAARWAALWDPLTYLLPYLGLLWAPHVSWALGLLCLGYLHLPEVGSPARHHLSNRAAAIAILLVGGLVYGAYALYFCQVTMLHGDEGQYLRVTQSLLHDGDMDLANNLEPGYVKEFHSVGFGPNKAPASPPGMVHSVHPIGLSVLLLPSYWAGLELWQNPRLACALTMAVLTALCLALGFLWLVGLGIERAAAGCSVGIVGSSIPVFLFSNQLYPEIPALAIALLVLVLLPHWQVPGGGYRSLGPGEPLLLGGVAALLVVLPFLHPRYLPLALVLAALVWLQARSSPRQRLTRGVLAAVALVGAVAHLSFNYAFSHDWLGPFLPGNAWDKGALQAGTWAISLPGHWLQVHKGLLNSSPVFLLCVLGWYAVARQRDRRLVVLAALYASTAVINGVHPDWTFGFCLPARFLLTAMPVLLYGLAVALPWVRRRSGACLLVALLLAIGWDGLGALLALPEMGYLKEYLWMRQVSYFYPIDVHFTPVDQASFAWLDLCFWAVLLAAAAGPLSLLPHMRSGLRWGLLASAALLPFLWGRLDPITSRLQAGVSSRLLLLPGRQVNRTEFQPSKEYNSSTGTRQEDGLCTARAPQDRLGLLNSYYLPPLAPGAYRVGLTDLQVESDEGQVAGHLVVSQRTVLPAVASWTRYLSQPLLAPSAPETEALYFDLDRFSLGYVYVEFSGYGAISHRKPQVTFVPMQERAGYLPIDRLALPDSSDMRVATAYLALEPGRYRARFELSGTAFSTLFGRQSAPVAMAVYAAPVLTEEDHSWLAGLVGLWLEQPNRSSFVTVGRGDYVRPLVESFQAPWWTVAPFVGDRAWELDFALDTPQEVWFAAKYEGSADLRITGLVLLRQSHAGDNPREDRLAGRPASHSAVR